MSKATETVVETVVEVVEDVKAFSLSSVLPLVLEKFGVPRALEDLLQEFVGGESKFDIRRVLKRQLERRITAQEGRNGGELFARALVKQIDFHYEAEVQGLAMEERHAVVSALVANVARQFVLVADTLLQYPEVARDVNVCKQKVDIRGLATARLRRTQLTEQIKHGMVNAIRALVGDENLG